MKTTHQSLALLAALVAFTVFAANSPNAQGAPKGKRTASVRMVMQTTDKHLPVGRVAGYSILVKNTGTTPLTGVVVTDHPSGGTILVAAPGASIVGGEAIWTLPDLAPGASVTLSISLAALQAGTYCNTATVTTTQGVTDSSRACSSWD